MSKNKIKYTLFGTILSNGSFHFCLLNNPQLQKSFHYKKTDLLNHSVWTGQQFKEQTEISSFIGRFNHK